MSGGLAALLDDIAALAKLAAASVDDVAASAGRAGVKAAGLVVDDTAVTPQYVQNFSANRELPAIRKIAIGSLKNKLLIILPAILLLSEFLPWVITPLLMLGGAYLCYEGAEKIWEKLTGHGSDEKAQKLLNREAVDEDAMVSSAIRTDFILSAEIMVISLKEVADSGLISRAATLILVGVGMTVLVYGAVGLIVRMDDTGLALAQRDSDFAKRFGLGLVAAMPKLLKALTIVGIAAMLWVGGHILLVGIKDLGFSALYDFVHHFEELAAHSVTMFSGFVGWSVNTLFSAILGLAVGAVLVAVLHLIPGRGHEAAH